MYFTYSLILALGLVLASPYFLVRFRKYWPTLADRFGFLRLPPLKDAVWVHAVSVGEVRAVEILLERLRDRFRGKPLVVSTATPSGQQLARRMGRGIDHTFFFPIDLPWCVRRAIERVDPHIVIIAETEIWPNFLRACRSRGIPVVMINGRISDRSFPRYCLLRRWLRKVFDDYTVLGMQSELDRQRIEAIGADPQKVSVFGNLKYDAAAAARPVEPMLASLLREWDKVWIAASTMPDEEELVLDAFTQVTAAEPGLKLVLAPRHADRFDAVEDLIRRRGFACVRRTALPRESSAVPVLLLDTIGELASLFQFATIVFVGGSLVPRGGHNVLEPARYRKPIIFGPHMENFREIVRVFLDADAAVQIGRPAELAPALTRLLQNQQEATELGRKARAIVDQNTGATERVLRVLQPVEAER
jgi:3-deoxy-D-manno-octulosonic-acid transferase